MTGMTLWIPGGWVRVFRYGFGIRLPQINFIFWLGDAK